MMNLVPYAQSTQSNQSLPQYPQHRPSVQYQPVQAVVTQTLVPQPFFNPTIVYPSPPMQQVPVGYPIQQFDQQVRRPSQVYPVQLQQIQSAAPPQYQTTAHPKTHPTTRSFFR